MPQDLTQLSIRLKLPYYPWQGRWDAVRADPAMGSHVDAMIAALEAAGPAEERLRGMTRHVGSALAAFAASGSRDSRPVDALDYVETELRVVFFRDLAEAIGTAAAPPDQRIIALTKLRALIDADPPVGVPAPNEHQPWSTLARQTAELSVDGVIERLSP